jgi:hypothetical protein
VLRDHKLRVLLLDLLVDVDQRRRDLDALPDREGEAVSLASYEIRKIGCQFRDEAQDRSICTNADDRG